MAAYKLILLPADPLCPLVNCEQLAGELQAIGLVRAPVALEDNVFYPTGDNFLQLVSFLGCSPMIELDPPADRTTLLTASAAGKFCHLFLNCTETLAFRADSQCPPPRCPDCRQPVADWQTAIESWKKNTAQSDWICTHCGFAGQLTALQFRKAAGFGRTFIEIRGIYPSEAVPTDALLDTLQRLTNGPWKTIYMKE
ncbi:MAG: hypothetical protein QNL87_09380 [Gammaproteobacteria bacterium]|nr:hypothetical protein [Gammaproteobacteria bacterium]